MQNYIELQIKKVLVERKMSMEKLAQSIKVSRGGLINMLANNSMKVETLMKIAEVLDVDISYFLSESKSKTIDMVKELQRLSLPRELRSEEIEQLKKRIGELEELLGANKKELSNARILFYNFAFTIWRELNDNVMIKNKKDLEIIKDEYFAALLSWYHDEKALEVINNKQMYDFFTKLIKEAREYKMKFKKE